MSRRFLFGHHRSSPGLSNSVFGRGRSPHLVAQPILIVDERAMDLLEHSLGPAMNSTYGQRLSISREEEREPLPLYRDEQRILSRRKGRHPSALGQIVRDEETGMESRLFEDLLVSGEHLASRGDGQESLAS